MTRMARTGHLLSRPQHGPVGRSRASPRPLEWSVQGQPRNEGGEGAMGQQKKMVRISVEVRNGTARFRVGVQGQSIREALGVVGGRYPRGVVEVAFPIEPETFFVREQAHKEA